MVPCIYQQNKRHRFGERLCLFVVVFIVTTIFIGGCSPSHDGFLVRTNLQEADDLFDQGRYGDSLVRYAELFAQYPLAGDRILFEMGVIYAHPENDRKDYQKSLECFEKLLQEYPGSWYRQDSKAMISLVTKIMTPDKKTLTEQTQIDSLEREIKSKGNEILSLQNKIKMLEQKIQVMQNGPADKILVLKKERLLMLLSKGKVLRTYRIALGGNPKGPKEREGDNKTPEGIYTIDSRNKDSGYHLSLRISYPNEKDKKRARQLGVPPGGDIMIHGIKNGYSWIGEFHTGFDWTKGCIAVTDEEIEEIARLTPIGTTIDIRP